MTDTRTAREILDDVIGFTACANEGVDPDELLDRYAAEIRRSVEAERDGAYRERAQLVALLAALYPAVLAPALDVDEPGWQILYLALPTGQASWHIHPRDADLYGHVEQVPAGDPRAQWDGHTTEQKYAQIAQLIAHRAKRCGRDCREGHTYRGRCELASPYFEEQP